MHHLYRQLEKYGGPVSFSLALLLSLGFLLIIFSDIADTSLTWMYTSSDKIYSPLIFRDIFVDGSGISGWHLNAAPNFFPDMFVYFILMAIFREVLVTDFVFSLLQYFSFLLLIYWLYRQISRQYSIKYTALFIFLMFFVLLIPVYTDRFLLTFQFISISYHFGSAIMSLLAFNLLLTWFRKRKHLAWLCLVVVLAVISDRLFLVQFVIPLLPLLILLFWKTHRKLLLVPLVAVVVSSVVGWLIFRLIALTDAISIISTGFKMFNFENIQPSWENLLSHMSKIFREYHAERGFLVIAMLAFTGALVFLLLRLKKIFSDAIPDERKPVIYMVIIFTIFMPVVFLMPVINGAYVGPAIIRFNIMGLAMGTILLPLLIMTWEPVRARINRLLPYLLPVTSLVFVVLFIVRLNNASFGEGMNNYFSFIPKRAQVLDELKEPYDLKYGIGGYWQSKRTMAYSRNGVRLYTVDAKFQPWYHTMNKNWYHDGGKGKHKDPVFNFISLDGLKNTDKLFEIFDHRVDTLYNDGDIVIAKVPEFRFDRKTREIILLEQRPLTSGPK